MVTSEEIARVPLFASPGAGRRARGSRRPVPDIRLAAGEFAVHEGEERALFAVLEGRIEVVKVVDGIERVLGERLPGASSARFRSPSARLSERLPRVRAVARHADRGARLLLGRGRSARGGGAVGKLARERIGGLQGVAAEAPQARALVLGHRWDAACSDLRRFLDRNQITFEWMTPDAQRARERWGGESAAGRRLPGPARPERRRRSCGRACAPSPSSSASRRAPTAGRLRRRRHRRRAGGPRRRGVRRVRGPAHDRDRARGAGRPGRVVVADRELPRVPCRACRATSSASGRSQQARRLGAEILVTRSITGIDPAHATASTSTAATSCAAPRSSSPRA